MKTFYKLIAIAFILMTAACNGSETIETSAFSFEKPADYSQNKDRISIPDFSETAVMSNANGGMSIVAFPAGPDVEKFLYAQSFGGVNAELRNCSFDSISETEIGSRKTSKVGFEGKISGKGVRGTLYAFEEGDYLFLIMGFGFDGTPDDIESMIATIKAKSDGRSPEEIKAARLAAIVRVSNSSLPRAVDEVTTWKAVTIDNTRNCIVMDMEISGNSADLDLDFFQDFLNTNREEAVIPTFRDQRSADYLIEMPARLGYDFEYIYTTAEDGKIIGRMHIANSEIND